MCLRKCLNGGFFTQKLLKYKCLYTVMILSFWTDMPRQTVQTQIRLLLEQSDQGLHCLPFRLHRLDSFSIVELHSSNFRVIKTNFLGVRIFRKFTVYSKLNEYMELYMYQRSRSFFDLGPRSLRFRHQNPLRKHWVNRFRHQHF